MTVSNPTDRSFKPYKDLFCFNFKGDISYGIKVSNNDSTKNHNITIENYSKFRVIQNILNSSGKKIHSLEESRLNLDHALDNYSGKTNEQIERIFYVAFGALCLSTLFLPSILLSVGMGVAATTITSFSLGIILGVGLTLYKCTRISTEDLEKAKDKHQNNLNEVENFYDEDLSKFKENIVSSKENHGHVTYKKETIDYLKNLLNQEENSETLKEKDIDYSIIQQYDNYFKDQQEKLKTELDHAEDLTSRFNDLTGKKANKKAENE